MESLSAAVLQKTPVKSQMILWIMLIVIVWLILWASYAEIDELARGVGKVIPSKQVQIVQNLEGGIISEILVDEGEKVEAGQELVKIDDTSFSSSYEENRLRYLELKAKSIRLEAEASGQPFRVDKKTKAEMTDLILQEESLYYTNRQQLTKKLGILEEQVAQRRNELREAQAKEKQLRTNYKLIAKEVEITKPLVESGLVSQVEYLKLSREAATTKGELDAVTLSIPRIKSTIAEARNKIE